ncbi:protein RALF-like 4 [Apium graveolens]|uniref:protein RALF-like 4 n=1 Tax=Apium graveolens TaxID=4045 RepID=UPI003D7B3EA9
MGSRLALMATFLLVALASAVLADSSSRFFHENAEFGIPLNLGTCDSGVGTCNSSRRALAGAASHISYDALNENKVPCTQRGSSYYNCVASKRANPYQRGCSAATQCARY